MRRESSIKLCRRRNGRRRLDTNQALVTRTDIVQVGLLGHEVDFSQREATGGLFQVDATANTTLGTTLDLLVRCLVLNVVVLSQINQMTIAQYIQVGTSCLKCNVFRSIKQLVVTDQLGLVETPHFVARSKTVEKHLIQTEQITTARVVVARTNGGLFEALAPATHS